MPKTLLFDTWGTLVDNYSIADVIEQYVFESHIAQHIAEDWRFQHKWAMFHLTLSVTSAVIALPVLALFARVASFEFLRPDADIHIARKSGQRVTVSFGATKVAACSVVMIRPDGEPGYLLLGQIAWNLLRQDIFWLCCSLVA